MYTYKATLLRVVDGDTVSLDIDLGLETSRKITIRLHGINTPEMNTEEGKKAKEVLTSLLGQELIVLTLKDRREKYGRYLGILFNNVHNTQDPVSINAQMLQLGIATPYPKEQS
jgi:micrococcal nuclease